MNKNYIVYCEYCNYKKVIPEPENTGLTQAQQTVVQGGIPMKNKETGKIITPTDIKCMPRVKCPDCGRAITLRRYPVPMEVKDVPEQDQII